MDRPSVTRRYQNHHLDSTRWRVYQARPGDIVVTTSYKSGTTLTQTILAHLLHPELDPMPAIGALSPWPDARFHKRTTEELGQWLGEIEGRRILKSHLPLDGLPYFDEVTYLVVARDPRDVFMSLANHYANYTEMAYREFNGGAREGAALPPFPGDLHELWRNWMTRGWFDWESEGWPFWGNLHHTQSWWEWRHLPNVHFFNYADMLADHPGAVRRIASCIGCEARDSDVARIVERSSFASAKARAIAWDREHRDEPRQFRGGEEAFVYKGSNGRWREVLGSDDLQLYEQAKARVLSPECAVWLERGGLA